MLENTPQIDGVMFDMDGLIFNSEDIYSRTGEVILERRGHNFCEGLKAAMMGLPQQPTFQAMIDWHSLPDHWSEIAAESNEDFLSLVPEMIEKMPGLDTLLDKLDALNIPRAIGTSSARIIADECLGYCKLLDRFAFILSNESITNGKPDPEIYLLGAEKLGVAPEKMLVLEDSPNGAKAGVAAGAFTVTVPNIHTQDLEFPEGIAMRVDRLDAPELLQLLA